MRQYLELCGCILMAAQALSCDLSRESEHCTTNSYGVRKCFYLCNEVKTWNEAKTYCEGNGGHLVADNGTRPMENVMELLQQERVEEAWTSGRSGPRFWNWGTVSGVPVPLYYQGCYRTPLMPDNDAEMNFYRGLIGINGAASCRQDCLEQRFKFYTLKKYLRWNMNTSIQDIRGSFKCYCGNSFGRLSLSTACKMDCVDFHACGTNYSSAVYSVNEGADVMWSGGTPESPSTPRGQGLCIQGRSRRLQNALHVTVNSASCDREFIPICVAEIPCQAGETIGSHDEAICYKVMSLPVNWATAVHICQDYDKSRESQILNLHKDAIHEDLQQILRHEVDFWTGGSSFVWAWHQGNNQVDFTQYLWNVRLPHFPQPNKCAVIYKSRNWISRDCETYKVPFICEKGLIITIAHTCIWEKSTSNPLTLNPAPGAKVTELEDRASTLQNTTPAAETSAPPTDHINITVIIGSVLGSIICLLSVVIVTLCVLRCYPENQSSGQTVESTTHHDAPMQPIAVDVAPPRGDQYYESLQRQPENQNESTFYEIPQHYTRLQHGRT